MVTAVVLKAFNTFHSFSLRAILYCSPVDVSPIQNTSDNTNHNSETRRKGPFPGEPAWLWAMEILGSWAHLELVGLCFQGPAVRHGESFQRQTGRSLRLCTRAVSLSP